MSKEMINLCESVLKTAKDAGADDCRVAFSKRRFVEVHYREQKPENVKEAATRSISVDIFVNDRYSSQSSADLRKESLNSFVVNMIESARLLEEDTYRNLPDPKYYEGQQDIDLQLMDPDYKKITPELRHKMARELERSCLEAGGNKVISVSSQVYDDLREETIITSNGFMGETLSTVCYAFVEMTAQDEGDRRPNDYHYAVARAMGKLPSCKDIGKKAAARTMEMMGAKKLTTETLPIIIENRCAGRILDGLISAMNGWALQQKRSFLLDKKGKKIGSDLFTLIDDPLIVRGLGSCLYDGNGFAAKKRLMI